MKPASIETRPTPKQRLEARAASPGARQTTRGMTGISIPRTPASGPASSAKPRMSGQGCGRSEAAWGPGAKGGRGRDGAMTRPQPIVAPGGRSVADGNGIGGRYGSRVLEQDRFILDLGFPMA